MGLENARSDHSSVVVRIFRGDVCLGTGFLVHPDHILTCDHVTDRGTDEPLKVRFADGGFQAGVVEAVSEAHDLALIRIPKQQARTPVCFLKGLKVHHENALRKLNWRAIGYDLRDSEVFLSAASAGREPAFQWDDKTGTLLDVQVDLGLPSGFSGGPVSIEARGKALCIGISTRGGLDSVRSRIRLADCIVGFLEKSGLEVASQDASETFGPREIPPAIARQRPNSNEGRKQNRLWLWLATISLAAAAACAGIYLVQKLLPEKPSITRPLEAPPNMGKRGNLKPEPTVLPFYRVQIMMYSSATPPQLRINKKPVTPAEYNGRTAVIRLHPGIYQVDAYYPDKICTAVVSVTRDMNTEAECHLK